MAQGVVLPEQTLSALIFVLLGALIGILAPAAVEAIRRERDVPKFKAALRIELSDLRIRVALAAYHTEMRFGAINRTYLEWTKRALVANDGINDTTEILKLINTLLAQSDEVIAAFAETQRATQAGALSLKKYALPILDSRLPTLWMLDEGLQRQLLDVRARLDLMNEEIDQARVYFQLTYQGLNEENGSRANSNLTSSYRNIAVCAKTLVDRIDAVSSY